MTDNNKHLVRVGHEFAAAMSDDTPIITIAKMVTELASALDVQTARSEALAAALKASEANDADARCHVAELEEKCAALAAELQAIKSAIPAVKGIDYDNDNMDDVSLAEDIGFNDAINLIASRMKKTPAADAWVNEQRAVAYNDLCAAFVMHRTTAGLDDSDKVTVKEATDALLHCAAQLRGSENVPVERLLLNKLRDGRA